ncbi:MAG: NADPH-dependent F420 reductase [Alphaproteobacteria bacterium]
MTTRPRIAILGGTGSEGGGLALRLAAAGYAVAIGSRDAARAADAARAINARLNNKHASGMANEAAAESGEIVILAVPFAAQLPTLTTVRSHLIGKILIDVTVPLMPPKVSQVQLPPEQSAVFAAQAMLGPGVRVVSAFQNVAAHQLKDLDHEVDCDVLVCGDDKSARQAVVDLACACGMRAWQAGPLINSTAAEALTSVLIFMNRQYKSLGTGIRITGIPEAGIPETA